MKSSQNNGTALITGAATGIGAIYADRLARRGYDLTLVADNRDRLEALARKIRTETPRSAQVLVADLNNRAALMRVVDELRSDVTITTLVNSEDFAFDATSSLSESDTDKIETMISVNVIALTRVTRAVLPGFFARGEGAIINVTSIAPLAPGSLNSVYSATKAYVLAFSQSLRSELSGTGVHVQILMPVIDDVLSVDEVVDAALVGFDRREFVTIPSLPAIVDCNALELARLALHLSPRAGTCSASKP
jgi:hypothetical protein